MRVIPVLDLMGGQVVRAKEGRRESYRPIESPLCRGSEPRSMLGALLRLYRFSACYVADLDALMGRGTQRALWEELAVAYPALSFWVDQGRGWEPGRLPPRRVVPVIGSESLGDRALRGIDPAVSDFILSLDFRGDHLLGPTSLLRDGDAWPRRVIVMSLCHIGSAKGPDFRRLRRIRREHPTRQIIAAGGVRDESDLAELDAIGMDAVLVASALHDGRLSPETLARFGG